jgi:Kef-type K+ transport system membrane component KefB
MDVHIALLTLGGLFILGLAADEIGRRTRLPRVTLLILLGVAAGPHGLHLLPEEFADWYEFLAITALTMVAFLIGGSLSQSELLRHGRQIIVISLVVVISTILVVSGGLLAIGVTPVLALLLCGIATATAPAATQDVIRQSGAKGDFTDTLKGIVAIDDAWGLIAFSLILSAANAMLGNGTANALLTGLWDLGGAVAVGTLVGFPAAYLTGRLRPGEPMQAEALAVVFLCAGIAVWLEVSFLLAGITAGMIVINFAAHHTRPFHEIEHIEWPFMVLFFFLAGVSLRLDGWENFGLIVAGYVVLRALSRIAGGWIGAWLGKAPSPHRPWFGIALMPQAGVAVGMALVASQSLPAFGEILLPVTIGATVVFEILGPMGTLVALNRTGETESRRKVK